MKVYFFNLGRDANPLKDYKDGGYIHMADAVEWNAEKGKVYFSSLKNKNWSLIKATKVHHFLSESEAREACSFALLNYTKFLAKQIEIITDEAFRVSKGFM